MSRHQRGFLDFSAPRPDLRPFVEDDSAISWQGDGGGARGCSGCGCKVESTAGFDGRLVTAGGGPALQVLSQPGRSPFGMGHGFGPTSPPSGVGEDSTAEGLGVKIDLDCEGGMNLDEQTADLDCVGKIRPGFLCLFASIRAAEREAQKNCDAAAVLMEAALNFMQPVEELVGCEGKVSQVERNGCNSFSGKCSVSCETRS